MLNIGDKIVRNLNTRNSMITGGRPRWIFIVAGGMLTAAALGGCSASPDRPDDVLKTDTAAGTIVYRGLPLRLAAEKRKLSRVSSISTKEAVTERFDKATLTFNGCSNEGAASGGLDITVVDRPDYGVDAISAVLEEMSRQRNPVLEYEVVTINSGQDRYICDSANLVLPQTVPFTVSNVCGDASGPAKLISQCNVVKNEDGEDTSVLDLEKAPTNDGHLATYTGKVERTVLDLPNKGLKQIEISAPTDFDYVILD